jgi:hypothetical protein
MKWSDIQLSYLSGIIDGEGCFHIGRPGGKTHTLRLFVMNTSLPLIDYLYFTYGGWQYSRKIENKNWKIRHEWFVDRKIIDELLPLIYPFLIVKKEACEVAMEFRKTFPKIRTYHKIPEEIVSIREDCHHRMQILNKKGP